MDLEKASIPHGCRERDGSPWTRPHPPDWYCTGTSKQSGNQCKKRAGTGTDHPGVGKCSSHGGKTPIKTGRYSKIDRPRIKEKIERFADDSDPLDLTPELFMLRALVEDYIERYDEYTEALLEWHDSFGREDAIKKPTKVMDIISVGKFIAEIGSLVDRIQKMKERGSVTLETLNRVLEQLGVEVVKAAQEVISDEATRSELLGLIESRWGSIHIDTKSSR